MDEKQHMNNSVRFNGNKCLSVTSLLIHDMSVCMSESSYLCGFKVTLMACVYVCVGTMNGFRRRFFVILACLVAVFIIYWTCSKQTVNDVADVNQVCLAVVCLCRDYRFSSSSNGLIKCCFCFSLLICLW